MMYNYAQFILNKATNRWKWVAISLVGVDKRHAGCQSDMSV